MWGILKRVIATTLLVGLLAVNPLPVLSATASSPGKVCPRAGQTLLSGGKLYTCIKSGSKLVWNAGKPVTQKFVKTPKPRISGKAVVDETLTANPGSWDGGVRLSYQWLSGGSAIEGGNDRTYVPSDSDLGKKISVRVTGSKAGFSSVSKVSAKTASVKSPTVTAPVSQTQKVFKTTSVPRITGSPKVGGELVAQVGQWDSGVTFRYQWIKNNVAIPGANRFSYIPTQDDLGTFVTVAVTGTKKGFRSATQVSDVAYITATLNIFPSVSLPEIQGSAVVGSTLTADFSDWGVSGIRYTYQWTRNGSNIPVANSKSYRLTSADLSAFIAVRVSGSRSGYIPEMRTSNDVGPVQGVSAPPLLVFANATEPSVSGSLTPGSTLSASHAAWDTGVTYSFQWYLNGMAITGATLSTYEIRATDVGRTISVALTGAKSGYASQSRTRQAGIVTAAAFANAPTPTIEGLAREGSTLTLGAGSLNWSSPAQTSIQWLKNGVGVAGATGNSLALSSADIGAVFTVAVTGSAPGYTSTTKVSAPTAVVTAAAIVGSKPTISGTAQVGQILTANPVYWESGVSLAYQWLRNGTSIPGASSATYTLVTEDNATQVSVEVTGSKSGMPNLVQVSNAVSVTTTILTLTPTPTISGTPQVGQTLTANAGTWDSGVALSYRWSRSGVAITGATSATYVAVVADLNQAITVRVTGSKSGFSSVTRTSNPVTILSGSFTAAPTPTISGTAKLEQTLTGNRGTWDSGTSFAYQWLADGSAISGATATTFKLTASQIGKTITFAVTGSKTGVTTVTRTSAPTVAVFAGTFSSQPSPTISGSAMVGKVLTATAGSWDSGTGLVYQWKRGTSNISGARASTYTLVSADLNATISVDVTASLTGNLPVTKSSAGVGPVVAAAILVQGTPTIAGTAQVGTTLTGAIGTWESGLSFTRQWRRNGIAISGATALNYTLVAADQGATITLSVTGKSGSASATKTSSPTSAVAMGVFSSSPNGFLTSTYKVGTSVTGGVTAWSPTPTYTYQWLRNGVAVSGATSTTYQLTSADLGAFMSFAITGTLAGYTTKTSTVNSGTAVMEGAISPAPTPTIVGSNRVGQVLTASPGTWMSGATLTYQWLRGGTAISGATSASYTVLESDAGANISVAVRGSATAYASSTVTSTALKILTPPKLPTISSTFAKTTRFDVYWTWEANTTYGFTAKNASGTVVGQYTCSTTCVSPFWIESLPSNSAAVNYTLEYFATTDGGTVTGSTTASTYPRLTLNANTTSIVRTGNEFVYNFQQIPGWIYRFTDDPLKHNLGCRSIGSDRSSSQLKVWFSGTCYDKFEISDGRGNVSYVDSPNGSITTIPAPPPALSGTLSANSVSASGSISFTAEYFSYYDYYSYNLFILNSGGSVVTPSIAPTITRTGGEQSGVRSGTIYFTGLAAGTYTIRMDFRSSNDIRYGTAQEASITLGTVTVTAG
jgi:hypothetical protein